MTWLRIFKRNEWGAAYGEGWGTRPLPAPEAWLHHSDTPAPPVNASFEQDAAAVRYLDQIGYERFRSADVGYKRPEGAGISYTWAVAPSGRVFEGHNPKRNSSHTYGHNGASVGIVLIGNYESTKPTTQQIEAVARLLLEAKDTGIIKNARLDGGHSDVHATACPGGHAYARITDINKKVAEISNMGQPAPIDPNKGFTVDWIKEVQSYLKTLGFYNGAISGSLPDVIDSVRAFQGLNGLTVDGLPGNNTMTVLRTRVQEYELRIAQEKAQKEELIRKIASMRLAGADRWKTARATALAKLPAGKGILIASEGSADERYATAKSGGQVIYLPVKQGQDGVPSDTLAGVREYKPDWIRFVGGSTVVTDEAARAVLAAAGLL